jgi:GTPase SAR1 family protein
MVMGVMVVYDVTDELSFANVRTWMDSLAEQRRLRGFPVVLVGNKCDLTAQRVYDESPPRLRPLFLTKS